MSGRASWLAAGAVSVPFKTFEVGRGQVVGCSA